jgi:MFS family permease
MFFHRRTLFNKSLKILVFTNALILFAGAMLGPIYAIFVEDIGGDLMDASIAGAAFALAAGITVLVSGSFSDRISQKKYVVIFGYGLMGAGFLLLSFVQSVITLFLVQALIGIGEAIYSPAFDALYSKHLDHNKEGIQWSIWECMNYFTVFFGALIGGLVVTIFNFQTLFVIMASIAIGSAVYLFFLEKKNL